MEYLFGRVLLDKGSDENTNEVLHETHHLVNAECLQVVIAIETWSIVDIRFTYSLSESKPGYKD